MTVILGAYAVLLTAFFLYEYFRKDDKSAELFVECMEIVEKEESTSEKIKAISALNDLKNSLSPWYEKYLSTIGVVGLFSMTIAAGVQTINSTTQQTRADALQEDITELEEQVTAAEEFVADVSTAIQSGAFDTQRIGAVERRILSYRFDELRNATRLDTKQLREAFSLALVLREFETAVELLEQNRELVDDTNPADQLTLAEYYYLTRADGRAQQIVDNIPSSAAMGSRSLVKRLLVLKVALGAPIDDVVGDYANAFDIRRDLAIESLTREVNAYSNRATLSELPPE